LRKQVIKIVSWVMLLVFFVAVAPKEYLHEVLFHHHDTVHPLYKKGEIVITPKHIHCEFLGFAFAPYIASPPQTLTFREVTVHITSYVLSAYQFSYSSAHHVASLRGPPVYFS
jgi:hypothetical protein